MDANNYDQRLADHWTRFTNRFAVANTAKRDNVFEEIKTRYGEPHRKYHGTKHPVLLLDELQKLRWSKTEWFLEKDGMRNLAIEFAIWEHDIFYDATREDNERKSAEKALEHARELGFPVEEGELAKAYVLSTEYAHAAVPDDLGAQIVVDIDLSLLADKWENFAQSSKDIREEYSHVPDDEFITGRRNFLKKMLKRGRIYSTMHFFDKFEVAARQNLKRSLNEQFAL